MSNLESKHFEKCHYTKTKQTTIRRYFYIYNNIQSYHDFQTKLFVFILNLLKLIY